MISVAVARDGAAVAGNPRFRRRDGSTVWISESVRALVDPGSGETVYQGSIVDVTARRETQARLAANAANAAFLTHVTHELRTPLTGILSNARVALRDTGLDAGNRARFGLIVSGGEHLLALIDEVLDNLFGNAFKFTARGSVTPEVRHAEGRVRALRGDGHRHRHPG